SVPRETSRSPSNEGDSDTLRAAFPPAVPQTHQVMWAKAQRDAITHRFHASGPRGGGPDAWQSQSSLVQAAWGLPVVLSQRDRARRDRETARASAPPLARQIGVS